MSLKKNSGEFDPISRLYVQAKFTGLFAERTDVASSLVKLHKETFLESQSFEEEQQKPRELVKAVVFSALFEDHVAKEFVNTGMSCAVNHARIKSLRKLGLHVAETLPRSRGKQLSNVTGSEAKVVVRPNTEEVQGKGRVAEAFDIPYVVIADEDITGIKQEWSESRRKQVTETRL